MAEGARLRQGRRRGNITYPEQIPLRPSRGWVGLIRTPNEGAKDREIAAENLATIYSASVTSL